MAETPPALSSRLPNDIGILALPYTEQCSHGEASGQPPGVTLLSAAQYSTSYPRASLTPALFASKWMDTSVDMPNSLFRTLTVGELDRSLLSFEATHQQTGTVPAILHTSCGQGLAKICLAAAMPF